MKGRSLNIRWQRLVMPVLVALAGILMMVAAPLMSESAFASNLLLATGRAFLIGAAGWVVGLIVDWRLRVAISRADITVADNLAARKLQTRVRMMRRVAAILIAVLTVSMALMSLPIAREIGLSLFASAGVAGLIVGIAAQPVLANLIAGMQIAITQPIRIDDAVVVEGEWGWIEDIGLFHVTVKLWDERRLVTPLNYFNQNTFQNWTKESASIIGSVFWSVDYRAPLDEMRSKLAEICKASPLWDGRVCVLQVTAAGGESVELRALASARNSPEAWDLRCEIRERMITWLQHTFPEALPVRRAMGEMRLESMAGAESERSGRASVEQDIAT